MAVKSPIFGEANSLQKLIQILQGFFSDVEAEVNRTGPGTIVAFGGDVVPEGWLLCDGTEYNISKYPELAGVLKDLWGMPTAETFNVPDLIGHFLYGDDGSGVGTAGPDSNQMGMNVTPSRRIMWIIKV